MGLSGSERCVAQRGMPIIFFDGIMIYCTFVNLASIYSNPFACTPRVLVLQGCTWVTVAYCTVTTVVSKHYSISMYASGFMPRSVKSCAKASMRAKASAGSRAATADDCRYSRSIKSRLLRWAFSNTATLA